MFNNSLNLFYMTEHDPSYNEEAERYFERAQIMLSSNLVSREEAMKSALDNAKKAFEIKPDNLEYFDLLFGICRTLRKSIFEIGLEADLTPLVDEKRARIKIAEHTKDSAIQILKKLDEDTELAIKIHLLPEIELLEYCKEKVPDDPDILVELASMYLLIRRQRDAFKILLSVANENLEYVKFYFAVCHDRTMYKEIVEFYESHKAELDKIIEEDSLRKIIDNAYKQIAIQEGHRDLSLDYGKPIKGNDEDYLIALASDWQDPRIYDALVKFYTEQGDADNARYFKISAHKAAVLSQLIRLDRYQVADLDIIFSSYADKKDAKDKNPDTDFTPEEQETIECLRREAMNVRRHFELYREVLAYRHEPYTEYLNHLSWMYFNSSAEVTSRIKESESIILKLLKDWTEEQMKEAPKRKECVTDITDAIGYRVLTDTEEEARRFFELVKKTLNPVKQWKPLDNPTETNYRSLDVTGYYPKHQADILVQVQIRTKRIENEINHSYAAHAVMKAKKGTELERVVARDPFKYFHLLNNIFLNARDAYLHLLTSGSEHSHREIVQTYGDPPSFVVNF